MILTVTSGPATGQSLEVLREIVIGRKDADLTIADAELSRHHVALPAGRRRVRGRRPRVDARDLCRRLANRGHREAHRQRHGQRRPVGLFSIEMVVYFGLPFLLLGLASLHAGDDPRWLGVTGVAAGAYNCVVGVVQVFTDRPELWTHILLPIGVVYVSGSPAAPGLTAESG